MNDGKEVHIYAEATVTVYRPNEIYHREDGPAYIIEYDSGNTFEVWYFNDEIHRYGGPAVVEDAKDHWYFVHGDDMTAVVAKWLEERSYVWETMTDIEKWELDLFMRTLG